MSRSQSPRPLPWRLGGDDARARRSHRRSGRASRGVAFGGSGDSLEATFPSLFLIYSQPSLPGGTLRVHVAAFPSAWADCWRNHVRRPPFPPQGKFSSSRISGRCSTISTCVPASMFTSAPRVKSGYDANGSESRADAHRGRHPTSDRTPCRRSSRPSAPVGNRDCRDFPMLRALSPSCSMVPSPSSSLAVSWRRASC